MGSQFYFINLEYWYCIIYSLFGGRCAPVSQIDPNINASLQAASSTTETVVGAAESGAREGSSWLFRLFSGDAPGVSQATQSAVETPPGFLSSVFEAGGFVFGVIGGILWFVWSLYSAIALTVSGILFLIIIGSLFGLLFIRYREIALYASLPPQPVTENAIRAKWQKMLSGAMSNEPKAWRESIVSADIMLGELLESLGYPGLSTEEKLRAIPESAFVTLPAAWEAHRVKNFVSSGSSDYILTQREAFRVMKLYERVFEEFQLI